MYDQALVLLGKVSVGDQRLHGVIDANAASSSSAAQVFVLGSQEAKVQKPRATTKTDGMALRKQDGIKKTVVMHQKNLPEPSVTWRELGAKREKEPAARGILESFLTIEEPGSHALQRRAWSLRPPNRFRTLAEGALHTAREALRSRVSWPIQDGPEDPERKRRRETPPQEQPEPDLLPSEDAQEDAVLLKVSEVMREAGVWEPVWKVYQSDLSNRMLQIKCEVTDGTFSERRPQLVAGGAVEVQVHKYTKPYDWPVACRALADTKSLYEKRLRELLEEAFVKAELYDGTLGRACAEAASKMAAQLCVQVG